MPTAENAKLQYESGQSLVSFVALTASTDRKTFLSADALWSNRAGYKPDVKPNGLATGGRVTAGAAVETVAVAALTCYLAGAEESVLADSAVAIARPAASPAGLKKKSSVTINSAGAIAVVAGVDGAAFSDTRGADGGPPYIPLDSIEIAQVWLSSSSSALITSAEIKQVIGTHCERYDYPTWTVNRFNVTDGIIGYAGIEFVSALPAIHSDIPDSQQCEEQQESPHLLHTLPEIRREPRQICGHESRVLPVHLRM